MDLDRANADKIGPKIAELLAPYCDEGEKVNALTMILTTEHPCTDDHSQDDPPSPPHSGFTTFSVGYRNPAVTEDDARTATVSEMADGLIMEAIRQKQGVEEFRRNNRATEIGH
jgi:hypothetical protein